MRTILVLITVILFVFAWLSYREVGKTLSDDDTKSFEKLSYFRDGQFNNRYKWISPEKMNIEDKANLFKMITLSPHAPKFPLPVKPLDKRSFSEVPENDVIYWLGHSSAIVETDGFRLGIDLVLGNASPIPFMVRRYQKAPIKRQDLPKMDYVLITHSHYDHLERRTIKALKDSHFIVPLGVGEILQGWGIKSENISELAWNETFSDKAIKITAVETIHFSGRSFWDRNKTLWAAYVIETGNHKIFWGGDGGYGSHYAEIGQKYGPFDWASLEIDAWNSEWPMIHMFPEQMILAAQDLRAKRVLPIHWGVFDLAYHRWNKSIKRVAEKAQGKDFELMVPMIGEKLVPSKYVPDDWWQKVK